MPLRVRRHPTAMRLVIVAHNLSRLGTSFCPAVRPCCVPACSTSARASSGAAKGPLRGCAQPATMAARTMFRVKQQASGMDKVDCKQRNGAVRSG